MKRTPAIPMILLLLAFLLSGCLKKAPNAHTPSQDPAAGAPILIETATPSAILPPALSGDIKIQQLMLTSHTRWKNLIANAAVTLYPPSDVTAEAQITTVRIWIELPAKAKVISGPPDGAPTHTFVSDGANSRWGSDAVQPLPIELTESFNPPDGLSDTVYTHPLAGMLGTPVSDLIFPAGLAQRGGEYIITGKESFTNREVYVVEWSRQPEELVERFWVDTQTGILMRYQSYGKQGSETPVADISIHFLMLDTQLPQNTFDLNSPDLPSLATPQPTLDPNIPQLRILPDLDLVNVRSGPGTDYAILATLTPKVVVQLIGKTEPGDWYQVDVDGVTGWVFWELVEVSGADEVPVVSAP